MDDLPPIQNPHDALFRAVFGDPGCAAELFRSALPPAAASSVDWASLERIDASFIDDELRGRKADLLFSARAAGRTVLLYALFEHKSTADRWTPLQVLRYVLGIWDRWRHEHPRQRRLPAVLAVVLHHGRRPWHGPRTLRELIELGGLPDEVRDLQPDATFALDDLAAGDEQALLRRDFTVRVLLPLLHLRWLQQRADTAALLRSWRALHLALLELPDGRAIADRLVSYVAAVSNDHPDRLLSAYRSIHPTLEEKYMTTAEQLIQRGVRRGLEQGLQQGAMQLLTQLLQQRFGPLPDAAHERLRRASQHDLERMARAVLTAATLEDALA